MDRNKQNDFLKKNLWVGTSYFPLSCNWYWGYFHLASPVIGALGHSPKATLTFTAENTKGPNQANSFPKLILIQWEVKTNVSVFFWALDLIDRSFFWIVHLWFNFLTPTCPSRLGSLPLLCFFCGVFLTTWFCAGFFPTWTPWSPSPVPASWPTAFSSRLCLHLSACALSTEEGKALQLFVETC